MPALSLALRKTARAVKFKHRVYDWVEVIFIVIAKFKTLETLHLFFLSLRVILQIGTDQLFFEGWVILVFPDLYYYEFENL